MPPAVIALVTSLNRRDETLACLRSLGSTPAILLDDASTDGTAEAVAREFPHVEILRNHRTLGYIPNLNRGLERALDRDYVFVLNNDVTVAPDALDRLVAAAEADRRVGIAGPHMFLADRPDILWAAGGRISPWTWRASHHRQGRPADGLAGPRDVDYIPAAAMLVRSQALRAVGPFEPCFEAFYEDVDFSCRVRRAGWRVIHVPAARIWHKVGATMNATYSRDRRKFLVARNRQWCRRRNASPTARPVLHVLDALTTLVQIAYNLVCVSPSAAASVARGYAAGWRHPQTRDTIGDRHLL